MGKLTFPSELHIGISVCVKQTYVKANDVLRMRLSNEPVLSRS